MRRTFGPSPRCEQRATRSLSARERGQLSQLAASATAGLDPAYLSRRLAGYDEVWTARDARGVAGFLLVQPFPTPAGDLVYIGPAFSRGSAYVYAFAALMHARLRSKQPFAIAMEVENPSVERMLRQLLPGRVFPQGAEPRVPQAVRAFASAALARVPHVSDFDPTTMTSAVVEPMLPGRCPARYRVLLVRCDGSLEARAVIAHELCEGLKWLRARTRPSQTSVPTLPGDPDG